LTFRFSIVIPTYNEALNISKLIRSIYKYVKLDKKNYEIIIVDDNSNDNILHIVKVLKNKFFNLNIFIRKKKRRDLSKSCIFGFEKSKFDNILVMDADLQHDPKYINEMINIFQNSKFDFVVGCRNFDNIFFLKMPFLRILASKILIFFFKYLITSKTNDPMSGFFLFKKKIFKKNKNKLFGKGYKILVDLLCSSNKDVKVKDIFINFRERNYNVSKMNVRVLILILRFMAIHLIKKIQPYCV